MKKILILQIENRNDDRLQQLMDHNKKISLKNNLEYIFIHTSEFNTPPYWSKIFEIQKIMKQKSNVDYIFWLDSDAFLINYDNTKFQDFLKKYENYSMIISKDMPPWENGEFNAGSFIIKNNDIGRNIIDEWISYYNPEKWNYIDNKWTTDSEWAGKEYEQGSFIFNILKNSKYKKDIIQLTYNTLNNNNCEDINETISVHLAGNYKKDDNIFQKCLNIINNIEGFSNNNDNKWISVLLNILLLFFCVLFFYLFFIKKKYFKKNKYRFFMLF